MMELEPAALVFLERDRQRELLVMKVCCYDGTGTCRLSLSRERQTERAIGHEGFVVMMELVPAALVFLERYRESYWS